MSQVALVGRLVARPGRRDELAAVLTRAIAVAEREGRLAAVVHTSKEEPDVVVVYEIHADEPALAAAGGSDVLDGLVERIAALLAGRPAVTRLTPVGGAGVPMGSKVRCTACQDEHLVLGEYAPADFVCHICQLRDAV